MDKRGHKSKKSILSRDEKIINWFRRGQLSEPWVTSEELWNNPEVQKAVNRVNKLYEKNKRN